MNANILVLKLISFVMKDILASKSTYNYKDSGFHEITIGYNDGLRVQDSSGVSDWSYITLPTMKRCDFRQINILCFDEMSTESTMCEMNCNYRGFKIGICYSEPGPGNQPSGEWQRSRGPTYCYCSTCHNEQCMQYCYNFGYATGYCHESANYATICKCVGCDVSLCGKHCNNIYGNALQQSFCRDNQCKCLAKNCLNY